LLPSAIGLALTSLPHLVPGLVPPLVLHLVIDSELRLSLRSDDGLDILVPCAEGGRAPGKKEENFRLG
jgi:hypothetical protein